MQKVLYVCMYAVHVLLMNRLDLHIDFVNVLNSWCSSGSEMVSEIQHHF